MRAVTVGVLVVCVAVVALPRASCGGDDGPQAFVVSAPTSALLIEWTRVGEDVSGSMTRAQLAAPAADVFGGARLQAEAAREVERESLPFTGTINGASVRLLLGAGASGRPVNGRLDGDTLTMLLPWEGGPPTLRLTSGTRRDFDEAARRIRAAETRRARRVGGTRAQADAKARRAITRVATAYQKALAPASTDDPCRYMTAAAQADVVDNRLEGAPADCEAIVRYYEREAANDAPQNLGAAEVELRTLVTVPGGSGGRQADGAEVRFAAIPNSPIGVVEDHGSWRIAKYR